MTLRKICQWYHSPIPIDGLGPLDPGAPTTDGFCDVCLPLATMARRLNVGRPWVLRLLRHLIELEGEVDKRRWGGVPVLAHWLAARTDPAEQLTKAKIAQLRRIAGSTENYHRLLRIATLPGPKRLQRGWTAQEVVSYVAGLVAERKAERG